MAKRGPKPHEPTEATREVVKAMSAYGAPQWFIARKIGICEKSLRQYYRNELDEGMAEADMQISEMLFNKCRKGDTTAIIWYEKTRKGFREQQKIEHVGKGDGPIQSEEVTARERVTSRIDRLIAGATADGDSKQVH